MILWGNVIYLVRVNFFAVSYKPKKYQAVFFMDRQGQGKLH